MKKLGFIVNPLAGIGGSVALKGSDGDAIVEKALALGARQRSPERARLALAELASLAGEIEIYTCPGDMGESEARETGFTPIVIGEAHAGRTRAEDTRKAAKAMMEIPVDVILFAGGDGTARDIYDTVGTDAVVVGIPTGTKMHSGIYASSPADAGRLCSMYLSGIVKKTVELEVMDIDEDAFREGEVKAKLYGYLQIPDKPDLTQGIKGGGHSKDESVSLRGIADYVVSTMKEDVYYIIGSGTTCRPIMEAMGLPFTLLGVDVVRNRQLVANDVTERELIEIIKGNPAVIIVTPIGGQGYIFGRGNQQLSSEVISMVGKDNIMVVGTSGKLASLPGCHLRVDTGDVSLDAALKGPRKVICSDSEISILDIV